MPKGRPKQSFRGFVQGRLVMSQKIAGQDDVRLEVARLKAGAYQLQVTDFNGNIGTKAFFIAH